MRGRKDERRRGIPPLAASLPVLIGIILSIPAFRISYVWDDFVFLGRAQVFRWESLLPDPRAIFYRPISRDLYFGILGWFGPGGVLWAHILNACLFGLLVYLVMQLTSRLADRRAGYLSGILCASVGMMPFLVGWTTLAHDLLALVFVLAALHFQLRGRTTLAVLATACGLLSKETTVSVVPALAALNLILGRSPTRLLPRIASYGALVVGWALIHPGLRALAARGFRTGGTGYVGIDAGGRPEFFADACRVMLNLPPSHASIPWPDLPITLALLASLAGLAALALLWGRDSRPERYPGWQSAHGRAALLGAVLCVLPLGFLTASIRTWAPHYSAFPAVGLSILGGVLLNRLRGYWPIALVGSYMTLGTWLRGMVIDPSVWSERNVLKTSR